MSEAPSFDSTEDKRLWDLIKDDLGKDKKSDEEKKEAAETARKEAKEKEREVESDDRNEKLKEKVFETLKKRLGFGEGKEIVESIIDLRNSDDESSLFDLIQKEIQEVYRNRTTPERDKLATGLKAARAVIINDAKKRGITTPLKSQISDLQHIYPWETAKQYINDIDTGAYEEDLIPPEEWSRDFGGLLDEYRETVLYHMEDAEDKVENVVNDDSRRRKEVLKFRAWGTRPVDLEALYIKSKAAEEAPAPEPPPTMGTTTSETNQVVEELQLLRETISGERATKEDILKNEKWAERPVQIDVDHPPLYLREMKAEEREIFESRIKLQHGVYIKRNSPPNFEGLMKNDRLQSIRDTDMVNFWKMPGVKRAMQLYLLAIEGSRDGPSFIKHETDKAGHPVNRTIRYRDIQNQNDANFFRDNMVKLLSAELKTGDTNQALMERQINEKMKEYLRAGFHQNIAFDLARDEILNNISLMAIEAEQVAFNLHYLANTAESLQHNWVTEKRGIWKNIYKNRFVKWLAKNDIIPSSWGDVVVQKTDSVVMDDLLSVVPFMEAMHPLDPLIEQVFKSSGAKRDKGPFTYWAWKQTHKFIKSPFNTTGFQPDKEKPGEGISEYVLIADENSRKAMKKCWTVEKYKDDKGSTKFRMYVPECHARSTYGSYFEEAGYIDKIRRGEDISWKDNGINDGITWKKYSIDSGKANDRLAATLGDEKIEFSKVLDALAKVKKGDDAKFLRWYFYATNPGAVKTNSRLPRLFTNTEGRRYYLHKTHEILPRGKELFPWDRGGVSTYKV